MASVKDRLAYAIIKDARDSGVLKPGQTIYNPRNTGIALAMVCAVLSATPSLPTGRNVFHRAAQGYARVRR